MRVLSVLAAVFFFSSDRLSSLSVFISLPYLYDLIPFFLSTDNGLQLILPHTHRPPPPPPPRPGGGGCFRTLFPALAATYQNKIQSRAIQ